MLVVMLASLGENDKAMSSLTIDPQADDLIWMAFDGASWDDFHVLLAELKALTNTRTQPYCLVFDPSVDMPKGNPLPHIRSMLRYMESEPKFAYMVAIIPSWMKIAALFARVVLQMFGEVKVLNAGEVVDSREAALAAYHRYRVMSVARHLE